MAEGRKSKVELARELIKEAADRGLCPQYTLFDRCYTSKSILSLLEGLGWKHVACIKSNYLVAGKTVTVVQEAGLGGDCTYTLSSQSGTFPAGGGGTINVTGEELCAWQAVSGPCG